MDRLRVGDTAPDFALPDHQQQVFKLADLYPTHNLLLVFNLGFI